MTDTKTTPMATGDESIETRWVEAIPFRWGEIWCNLPCCGAAYRAYPVESILAPLRIRGSNEDPALTPAKHRDSTFRISILSAEADPFIHAIAGLDMALWGLADARRRITYESNIG